jgi:hypothetical protein
LVISASLKNSEYIINYGLTYKRLGVYAFLAMALIGLILLSLKSKKEDQCVSFQQNVLGVLWLDFGLQLRQLGWNYHCKQYQKKGFCRQLPPGFHQLQ